MCRLTIVAAPIAALFLASLGATDELKDKKAQLTKAIEEADLILVGKVSKTDLVPASSFSVGEVEASKVLKGDEKIKSALFRYSGRVRPSYAKAGVAGVWVLSKANNKRGWRGVLSFQPLTEEETVNALVKEIKNRNDKKPKNDR